MEKKIPPHILREMIKVDYSRLGCVDHGGWQGQPYEGSLSSVIEAAELIVEVSDLRDTLDNVVQEMEVAAKKPRRL